MLCLPFSEEVYLGGISEFVNLTKFFTPSVIRYRKFDYALAYALHHRATTPGLLWLDEIVSKGRIWLHNKNHKHHISTAANLPAKAWGCARRFVALTAAAGAADMETVILAIRMVCMWSDS